MKHPRITAVSEILTAALFCGVIGLPLLGTFFQWDFCPYEGENRVLAAMPDYRSTPLAKIPPAVNAYCNDHFGFRNTLLRRYRGLERRLGREERTSIATGADGWLFFDKTVKDYMGFRRFPEDKAAELARIFTERVEDLSRRSIPYLLVIPPNKIRIYPDKLAGATPSTEAVTRFEQLESRIPRRLEPNILYPCAALKAARAQRAVYYSNDTHWTSYGAYIAYREIIRSLRTWRPDLEPVPLSAFGSAPVCHVGDLQKLAGISGMVEEKVLYPKGERRVQASAYPVGPPHRWHSWPSNIPPPQLFSNPSGRGRLLVFHDSFGWPLMSFLPQHFEKTAFFWIYSSRESLEYLLRDFQPDIIIEIRVERFLDLMLERPDD